MILFLIAWRNLWRNKLRTLLTALTVALGLALLLISLGLGDGAHKQMIESAVRMGSGHVVIQSSGYQQRGGLERALTSDQVDQVLQWLEQARAEGVPILATSQRTFASGLASSADGSAGVQIIGVQPSVEKSASLFPDRLAEGEFLHDSDENRVLVGRGVARKLELGLGGRMVLMAQAAGTSEIQSRLVRVQGILETGQEELDQILVLAPLATCQEFFHLPGRLHQVAVLLDDYGYSEELARQGGQALAGLEVLSWRSALPELDDFIRVDDGGNYVFYTFLFLLIGFMVLNTLLMSVLERRREFSLLDALGLPAARRFILVLLEALFIALLASLAGFALAYPLHLYFERHGLPLDAFNMSEFSAAGVAFEPVMYSDLSVWRILQSVTAIVAMTLLLSFFPALRAARQGNVKLLGSE